MSTATLTSDGLPTEYPPVMASLLRLLRPWRTQVAGIVVAVLGAAAFELVPPLILRSIVDDHLTVGTAEGLLLLACLYLAATGTAQVITFIYNYLAATVAQGVLSDLRVRLFAHCQQLPASYFDRVAIGDVISRCTADIDTLDTVFSTHVSLLIANLVRLATISITMIALSAPLTLVAAFIIPPLAIVTRLLQVRVRQAERENRVAVGAINARLQENLRGTEVIRAFRREDDVVAGFRQVLSRGLGASNRASFFSAIYTPITAILAAIAVAALLWAGTQQAFAPFGISLGTLTAFLILIQRFFQPITALGEEWQTVQGAMAGAERIFGTLALHPHSSRSERPAPTEIGEPSVRLNAVRFGYAEERPVLHGISLEVQPGEHVALVGQTGAGKTSVLHLLAGLYLPWSGSISVAGRDPASLDESERPRLLGVVPQMVQLFSGTVLENLTLGDEAVSEEQVYEATRLAGADAFIQALPHGYETLLGGHGSGAGMRLSAGQEQLLALARALVHRPLVLLFDEATAAIDGASDASFRAALRQSVLRRRSAALTVAHRLSTAMETDRIIVLDRGRIVEQGTPVELATAGGRFAALLELEAAGWNWRTNP